MSRHFKSMHAHSCVPSEVSSLEVSPITGDNGSDPALSWKSQTPSFSPDLLNLVCNRGDAKGASEVRHGTSSIYFHCPAPQSSGYMILSGMETTIKPRKSCKVSVVWDLDRYLRPERPEGSLQMIRKDVDVQTFSPLLSMALVVSFQYRPSP